MDVKDLLTNEKLTRRFKSLFELVNYSIRVAEEMLKSGRDLHVRTDVQNPMYRVLLEILNDKEPVFKEEAAEPEIEKQPIRAWKTVSRAKTPT